jgi:hypothetical protein
MKHTLTTVDLNTVAITNNPLQMRDANSEALQLDGPTGIRARLIDGPGGLNAVGLMEPIIVIDSKEAAAIMGTDFVVADKPLTMVSGHGRGIGMLELGWTCCMASVISGLEDDEHSSAKDKLYAACQTANMSARFTKMDIAKMVHYWMWDVRFSDHTQGIKIAGERVRTVCGQAVDWTSSEVKSADYLHNNAPANVKARINSGQWSLSYAEKAVKAAVFTPKQKKAAAEIWDCKLEEVSDFWYAYVAQKENRKGMTKGGEDKKAVKKSFWSSEKEDTYTFTGEVDQLTEGAATAFKKNLDAVNTIKDDTMKAWLELVATGPDGKLTTKALLFSKFVNCHRTATKELGQPLDHFRKALVESEIDTEQQVTK